MKAECKTSEPGVELLSLHCSVCDHSIIGSPARVKRNISIVLLRTHDSPLRPPEHRKGMWSNVNIGQGLLCDKITVRDLVS